MAGFFIKFKLCNVRSVDVKISTFYFFINNKPLKFAPYNRPFWSKKG